MTDSKKPTSREELERIEDAWVENILNTSGDDLRIEITQDGDDPNAYVALADAMLASALEKCSRERLSRAKAEAAAFRTKKAQTVVPFSRESATIESTSDHPEPLMMAARKGKQLSRRDEDAVSRAKARLRQLEAEDPSK